MFLRTKNVKFNFRWGIKGETGNDSQLHGKKIPQNIE